MKQTLFFALFALLSVCAAAQIPTITDNTLLKFEEGNNTWKATADDLKAYLSLSGGGTVTSVSSGNLSPLFTTSVANASTTPAISYTLSNAGANTYLGNATGSSAAPSYTAAGALTKTDDANVTLTLGGNASTALLRDASLTLGWTGTLAVSRGGTGAATLTGLVQGNGAGAFTAITNSSTVGQVLRVTGASTYAWGALDLADGDAVTGTLAVNQGGTGLTAVGSDPTILGSNGTANVYFTPGITTTAAAIAWARSGSTLNLNLPNADASNRGTVSTAAQTFAGAKTFQDLGTFSAGVVGTATSGAAAVNVSGVLDGSLTTITANTTLDHTHNTVGVGTLSADITITLPACNSTRDGWEYTFVKKGTDAFAFIVDPNSTETFMDGATTKSIYSQSSTFWCKCDNTASHWVYSNTK